ncbi:hypothetical protein CVV38_03735 [Candidatus Peregrinibacteria bacterium HGW-Peregrinibacteria-1]|jgi:hypothetical protein|nr:MAG: hypothetical protein CVV38_03735 [Candidatus Peregrinibacteria bacterium HGW-Peregrinibacteria-1]
MAVFKYIVINKEGKKLSGTVEAPDQNRAREELNRLGFSILTLQSGTEIAPPTQNTPQFFFEAIEQKGKNLTGSIFAETKEQAIEKLKSEYFLNVTGIWKEGATESEIAASRAEMQQFRNDELNQITEGLREKKQIEIKQAKEKEFTNKKIDNILLKVRHLLTEFDSTFDEEQKALINKKIDKILRIKHSKNIQYILATAQELLQLLEDQEEILKEKGYKEERFKLRIKTQNLLNDLKKDQQQKTLNEDILNRIESWQKKNKSKTRGTLSTKVNNFFESIKEKLDVPPEIETQKQRIKYYNKQIFQLIKLYFKEPAPEYKEKVKVSIKTLFRARKKTIHAYRQAKMLRNIQVKSEVQEAPQGFFHNTITELNNFSGWLLTFYIAYYFLSIYLTTKDFSLATIPQGFKIYESNVFKFALLIIFLFHSLTAIKLNFFSRSKIVNIIFPVIFIFTSTIVILNF